MYIVDEQIDITTRAVMGLTVSCARCHDHKFDPFPTEDYYALAGIFRSTETLYGTSGGQGNRQAGKLASLEPIGTAAKPAPTKKPVAKKTDVPAKKPGNSKRLKQLVAQQKKVKQELNEARAKLSDKVKKNKKQTNRALKPIRTRLRKLNKQIQQLRGGGGGKKKKKKGGGAKKPSGPVAMGGREGAPADCRVHIRGNIRTLGDSVTRGFLQVVKF